MTALTDILPPTSWYPKSNEYDSEEDVGGEVTTIRRLEHILRGVILIQGGNVNKSALKSVASEVREEEKEKIQNITIDLPEEVKTSCRSIEKATFPPEKQQQIKQAREKIIDLRTRLLDKHIDAETKWSLSYLDEIEEKAKQFQHTEGKTVSFELTQYTDEGTAHDMPDELRGEDKINDQWVNKEVPKKHVKNTAAIPVSEFNIDLPVTLPSCVIKFDNITEPNRIAFAPLNGVMACTCRYKHEFRSQTICHHELMALKQISNEPHPMTFTNGKFPQRLKRFVHKSGYKKATELLNKNQQVI